MDLKIIEGKIALVEGKINSLLKERDRLLLEKELLIAQEQLERKYKVLAEIQEKLNKEVKETNAIVERMEYIRCKLAPMVEEPVDDTVSDVDDTVSEEPVDDTVSDVDDTVSEEPVTDEEPVDETVADVDTVVDNADKFTATERELLVYKPGERVKLIRVASRHLMNVTEEEVKDDAQFIKLLREADETVNRKEVI